MGVFDDKKFEQLDWMTQITETIDSELNGLLARLPDQVNFTMDSLLTMCDSSNYGLSISVSNVVRSFIKLDCEKHNLKGPSWEDEQQLIKCYKFEVSEDLEVDFTQRKLTGSLVLFKIVQTLEDETLQGMLGSKGIGELRYADHSPSVLSRMNEMLDLIGGCDDALKNRSCRRKVNVISHRLNEIFKNNEWRIRDMELSNKVGRWIKEYINTGNLAALTNLCKLKVMTHNNMPIYSIEEEK
jgi:hypothetical protein